MAFIYDYETPDGKAQSITSDRELSDDELDNKIYEKMQMSQPKPVVPSTPAVGTSTQQTISTPSSTSKLSPDQELKAKKFIASETGGVVNKQGQFEKDLVGKAIDHTPEILKVLGDKLNSGISYIGPDIKKTVKAYAGHRSPEEMESILTEVSQRANDLEEGGMATGKALQVALNSARMKTDAQNASQLVVSMAQMINPVKKFTGTLALVKSIGHTAAYMGVANGMADFVQQLTNGESVEDAAKHGVSIGTTIAVGSSLMGGALAGVAKGGKMTAEKIKEVLKSPTATYMQKVMAEKYMTKAAEVVKRIQGKVEKKQTSIGQVEKERVRLEKEKTILAGTTTTVDTTGMSTLQSIGANASHVASKMTTKLVERVANLSDRGHGAVSLMYENIFSDPKMKNLPDIDISDVAKMFDGERLPGGQEGSLFFKTVLMEASSGVKESVNKKGVKTTTSSLTTTSAAGKFKNYTTTQEGKVIGSGGTASMKGKVDWGVDMGDLEQKLRGNVDALNPKQIHFLISSIRGFAVKHTKDVNTHTFATKMFDAADALANKLGTALDNAGLDPQYKAVTKNYKDLLKFDRDTVTYQNTVLRGEAKAEHGKIPSYLNAAFEKADSGRFADTYGVDDIITDLQTGYGEVFNMGALAKQLGLDAEATRIGNVAKNLVKFTLNKNKILRQQGNPALDIKGHLEDIYKKTSGEVNNVVGADNFAKQVIDDTQNAIDLLKQKQYNIKTSKKYLAAEHATKEYSADRGDYSVVSASVMLGSFRAASMGVLMAMPFLPGSNELKGGLSVLIGLGNLPVLAVAAKKHGPVAANLATNGAKWMSSKMDDVLATYNSMDLSRVPAKQQSKLRSLMEVQLPKMVAHFNDEFGEDKPIQSPKDSKPSDPYSSAGFDSGINYSEEEIQAFQEGNQ